MRAVFQSLSAFASDPRRRANAPVNTYSALNLLQRYKEKLILLFFSAKKLDVKSSFSFIKLKLCQFLPIFTAEMRSESLIYSRPPLKWGEKKFVYIDEMAGLTASHVANITSSNTDVFGHYLFGPPPDFFFGGCMPMMPPPRFQKSSSSFLRPQPPVWPPPPELMTGPPEPRKRVVTASQVIILISLISFVTSLSHHSYTPPSVRGRGTRRHPAKNHSSYTCGKTSSCSSCYWSHHKQQ